MRALVLDDYSVLAVHEQEAPTAGPGEVLIKVAAAGICGSDIHGFTGENGRRVPGQVMGHEGGGTVAAVGDGVDLAVGTPVTYNPLIACGACEACAGRSPQWCPERRVLGVTPDLPAAFADYLVVPVDNVRLLPAGLDPSRGALIEPLAVAVHAIRRAAVVAGDTVLVVGGGPIGQSVVLALAECSPARIVVSDLSADRRTLVASLSTTELPVDVLDPTVAPMADQLRALTGRLADVTIEAVGVSASTADALHATRNGGTVALVGMGSPRLAVEAYAVSTFERSLVGCFCYSYEDFDAAVAWAGAHADRLELLVSAEVGFDAAQQAFLDLAGSTPPAGKVLIRP